MMKESPPASMGIRIGYGVAALVALFALFLHFSNWLRSGASNWPIVANISGLAILMTTGAVDPRSVKVRMLATLIGVLLIFSSAFVLWSRN